MNAPRPVVQPPQQGLIGGLERWSTPVLILEPAVDGTTDRNDFIVVAANVAALDEFGTLVVGCRLDRGGPFGPAGSLVGEASAALRNDEVRVADRSVAASDSDVRHLRYTMLPSAPQITVFIEDVTTEMRLRRELAAVDQTLARVERWGNLGVWELDLTTGSLYWSTQVFEILGLDESGVDTFMNVVHAEDCTTLEHVGLRAITQPGPYRVTHRIVRDGDVRTLDQHMQSVPGADGRPARLLGTMIDVSATEALQQDLHQAVQMRTLGLLAGGIAHDLKNAMAIVAGHADMLTTQLTEDSPLRPSIEAISRAGHRAATLTRNLMNLGRTAELCPGLVDVRELFQDVVQLVSPSLDASVEVDLCNDDNPLVVADRSRLSQVLVDLILNAGDADAGVITLTFETIDLPMADRRCAEQQVPPGSYGIVGVVDDGCGMDTATIQRACEPYFTTKDAQTGSGLGLANAHEFSRRSGGLLEIESAVGGGTTMSLLLPRREPDAASHPRPSETRPIRILVAAADADRARHLGALLDISDRDQLVTASSPTSVAITLRTEPIDILIVDNDAIGTDQLLSLPRPTHTLVVHADPASYGSPAGHLDVITEGALHDAVRARIGRAGRDR